MPLICSWSVKEEGVVEFVPWEYNEAEEETVITRLFGALARILYTMRQRLTWSGNSEACRPWLQICLDSILVTCGLAYGSGYVD